MVLDNSIVASPAQHPCQLLRLPAVNLVLMFLAFIQAVAKLFTPMLRPLCDLRLFRPATWASPPLIPHRPVRLPRPDLAASVR